MASAAASGGKASPEDGTELLIVAAVVLLLFGTRLPKVMRSLGEGIVEFKRGVQGIEDTGPASRDAGRPDAR